jgi:hypothetical protein
MHPLEGSYQEAILLPTQPLTTSFRCMPLGTLHERSRVAFEGANLGEVTPRTSAHRAGGCAVPGRSRAVRVQGTAGSGWRQSREGVLM